MATRHGIRHRLLTILLLGVLTSALSLTALVHLLTTSMGQRVERARDAVTEVVDRMAHEPAQITEPAPNGFIGLRGGIWDGTTAPPEGLPHHWIDPVRTAIQQTAGRDGHFLTETPLGDATLVVGAERGTAGQIVWGAYLVKPLPSLRNWLWIVCLLAVATALLVATSAYAMVTVNRGAAAVRASLTALATDLHAPIPRPRVRELGDIADGIAHLAENLIRARQEEERLGRALAERERLAALGRVAAGVAHEVRNPLASIKLRLDLAAASVKLPAPAETAIAHASSEIARLDRLVADLLVVAGRAIGAKHDASLGALVKARAEALAPWGETRHVAIKVVGDASTAIDPDSMARAIDNLLRNAVEASPANGEVVARVLTEAGRVVLRVEDAGPGVPEARAPELFEPFFTTKPDGTGLGLAISRSIARAHGGDLEYSRQGAKTRFDLSLAPAEAQREAAE